MAVSGWQIPSDGEPWVRVNDPWDGSVEDVPLASLRSSSKGVWTHTYTTKRPTGGNGG